jgi:ABC-type glycerol-3-phosphate transport system substrate-binding protein
MRRTKKRSLVRFGGVVGASISLTLVGGFGTVASSAQSVVSAVKADAATPPLTIWVDPPRVPAVDAFEKAFPSIKIQINVLSDNVGNDQLQGKFELFDRVGSGWPDVIFFPTEDDIAWASDPQINYALNLTKLAANVRGGFPKAALAPCVINGQLRCLRNDDGADVLWYNAVLFKKWGYTAPTTWPQYEALGLKIAQQHPGYYVGLLGDSYAEGRYLWASECPTNLPVGVNKVEIDLNSPNCTRMENLLDTLLKAKVVATSGIVDSSTATSVGPKLVMTPGAEWYGSYLYEGTYHVPAGQITAGPSLTWPGEDVTGAEGGAFWTVSSHLSGQLQAEAVKFAEWAATSPIWQVNVSVATFPAYSSDQRPWLQKNVISNAYYYAPDRQAQANAMAAATRIVWSGRAYDQYDTGEIWQQVITPALTQGKNLASVWAEFQTQLVDTAKSFGYSVTTG